MGIHSLRNIGFSFTDAETTCSKWREKFTGFDFSKNRGYITSEYDGEYITVTYLGKEYRLHTADGILEKKTTEGWTGRLQMHEALFVYHYIGDEKKPSSAGCEWIPENMLDPVRVRMSDRLSPLLTEFARGFEGKTGLFSEKCKKAGGIYEESNGDAAFVFCPVPEIPVKLVFWDMDEDFPAQLKAYVRENAAELIEYESISFMIADVLTLIVSAEI